jgi:hypothetical protein
MPTTAVCCVWPPTAPSSRRSARRAPAPASSPSRAAWRSTAGGLLVADSGNNRIERFVGVAPVRGCATITLKASAAAVKAMRAALKKGGYITAGVTITATSKDGVVDTAGVTWQYH